ncbi:ATPase/histidine kinase/DNA gyrase B/HSP90 domain protein [Anaerococcus vaginalis ATCC 51170]|uniref:histidine kinase n=2 Tax=Anaerococcus vaginalis TaxID=33037 RepID=C7HTG3_9FIRM|nr:ATPase/histidine kinase/DNA gyrase B/HSP90 domain protein [Anaerococcus vaginalis ATCC 51170]
MDTGWIEMLYIFWIISLGLLYYFLEKRKKNRINELIDLIENMKNQNYKIPMKQDDFSILEDKIYKLFIEIVEAKETTSKNSEKQIEYLEDIAHQIKTPITSMLFSIENLEMDFPDIEDIEILKRQLLRLNSLSDILLKLSSLDANKELMKNEDVRLDELIFYSLDTLNLKKSVRIIIDDSLKENIICGDFYWLAEAIINILKNADNRKSCDKITISSEKNPLYTSLIIEDNGGGIEKENMKKIFKRFYKTPDSNGFGIGLAMAKTIVEKNNGEISVSNIDVGARFEIKFYNVT